MAIHCPSPIMPSSALFSASTGITHTRSSCTCMRSCVVQTQPCSAGRQDAASAALPSSPPAFSCAGRAAHEESISRNGFPLRALKEHRNHTSEAHQRTRGSCERLRTVGSQMRTSLDGAREAHSDGYMVVSAGARVFEPKCKFALPGTMCAMPTESSVIGTMGSWRCRSVCSG